MTALERHAVVELGGADADERRRLDAAHAVLMLALAAELAADSGHAVTSRAVSGFIRAGQSRTALVIEAPRIVVSGLDVHLAQHAERRVQGRSDV